MSTAGHPQTEDEIARAAAQETWAAFEFLVRCGIPARDITPLVIQHDPNTKHVILSVNSAVALKPFNVSVATLYAKEDAFKKQYAIWIKSCRPQPDDTERDRDQREKILSQIFADSQIWNARRTVVQFLLVRGVRVPDAMVKA